MRRDNKVKTRRILLVSFALNMALATTLVVLRWGFPASPAPTVVEGEGTVTRTVTNEVVSLPIADAPAATTTPAFHWRMIESEDVRQYVANLRHIGCPEGVLRDLAVAEVDRQFKPRLEFTEVSYQPWHGHDRRQADRHAWEERKAAAAREKSALIRELLGYEWNSELSKLWDSEPSLFVFLGFLSEDKARQVMAVVGSRMEKAENVMRRAGGIIIDEDYDLFRKVRSDIQTELSRLLSPAELEELEVRGQLGLVAAEKLYFDGMDINGFEFREIMLASRSYKDCLSELGLAGDTRAKAEEATRFAKFEKAIAARLGEARLADFQRAQDKNFRSTLAFAKKQKLAKETAVKVYDARRGAEQQAREIRNDNSLSVEEKLAALQFLHETTAASLTSALGPVAANYFNGPGKWLKEVTITSAKKLKPPAGVHH